MLLLHGFGMLKAIVPGHCILRQMKIMQDVNAQQSLTFYFFSFICQKNIVFLSLKIDFLLIVKQCTYSLLAKVY